MTWRVVYEDGIPVRMVWDHEPELERMAAADPGFSGRCGHCEREVTNADPDHRVTPILKGGRGVECKRRGDYR